MCWMFRTLVSGGNKDSIWSFDAITEVWITTNLTLGSPNSNHAIAVIDSCPTSAGAWIRHTFYLFIADENTAATAPPPTTTTTEIPIPEGDL